MYLRMQSAGHEVRVYVGEEEGHDIFAGMLTFTPDWEGELPWIREAGPDGILIFEGIGWGETQDRLRADGFNVIGGGALGDRLETDRAYGQQVLRDIGLETADSYEFDDFERAIAFVEKTRKRYVLKFSGQGFASTRNYVGELEDGADVLGVLRLQSDRWKYDERPHFVLMDFVHGVEVGLGAFFNGHSFLHPANLDWEHKRFFPGNLGELTGEMGTLATYQGADVLFNRTLRHIEPLLRSSGYAGYINLNTIVNEQGIFPLELTCRFGYPGFVILDAMHAVDWARIFAQMIRRTSLDLPVREGFAVCVVLTVPPFPYPHGYENLSRGAPILFASDLSDTDREQLHYAEVRMDGKHLVTAGSIGYVMVVTGLGMTVEDARGDAYRRVKKVVIPNLRYRLDIGERFIERDRADMTRWGYLTPSSRR
jgi:phosphoribosylamine---glycine ligase